VEFIDRATVIILDSFDVEVKFGLEDLGKFWDRPAIRFRLGRGGGHKRGWY
jgi:hypothetical protein